MFIKTNYYPLVNCLFRSQSETLITKVPNPPLDSPVKSSYLLDAIATKSIYSYLVRIYFVPIIFIVPSPLYDLSKTINSPFSSQ